MPTDDRDREEDLERLIAGITESIREAPGEEILEEVRAKGRDPEASAEETRRVLLDVVTQHRKKRLSRARLQRLEEAAARSEQEYNLPRTPEERLQLLTAALHHQPWVSDLVTVQHRNLESLPDEDVESLLRQLAELGVLDELS